MGMSFWTIFCGNDEGSLEVGRKLNAGFSSVINSNSCISNILVISVDFVLLFICLFIFIRKLLLRKVVLLSQHYSPLQICSAIFNVCLGLAYLGYGVWIFIEELSIDQNVLPLHQWAAMLFQGFTWLLLGLNVSLRNLHHPHARTLKLCSILVFLVAGFLCVCSIWEAVVDEGVSVATVLNILSFLGASLFVFCAFWRQKYKETDALYAPLQSEEADGTGQIDSSSNVTPFATAGLLSRLSFWWLNPLMKKGKEMLLDDQHIPKLRQADRAQTCYSMYMERLSKLKKKGSSDPPSIVLEIFLWQRKAFIISGIFALTKVLAVSTGPLFLKAFIAVAEGNTTFAYEGYILTVGLFLAKFIESLSERQWFFRTRLIGLQVRSLLAAAIYQKQLRLSNASKMSHSPGEIMNYVIVDAYRIGEFPYWSHQIWSTSLQLCLALAIIYYSVGLATLAVVTIITLVVLSSSPLAKLQYKYQSKLMLAQDKRLKVITEALANMKVLKLYAWETHFKKVVESARKEELEWIAAVLFKRSYSLLLFWSSTILTSVATFWACYFLGISLNTSNIFTFLAGLRLVQEPIRLLPDVVAVYIEAKVSIDRIVRFLEAPELENKEKTQKHDGEEVEQSIFIKTTEMSWNSNSVKATLRNINLVVKSGEKIAICGEVGSGKSTLLAAILGEAPIVNGKVHVNGKLAYVPQTAWIQTGSIQENILFGSPMDSVRYQEVLAKCSLVKDLQMLPYGDLTEIGERGVTLSGGQKQRVQLARALYQNADVYLLDDPFSAVDAHTAASLFNEYVMGALSGKTVLLVTHQVDFLPAFNSILFMYAGEILRAGTYDELLESSQEFRDLVNANTDSAASERHVKHASNRKRETAIREIEKVYVEEEVIAPFGDQLINQEERETGDTGLKPYIQYLKHDKGFLYFTLSNLFHIMFFAGQLLQLYWLAAEIQNSNVSTLRLITVYSVIGCVLIIFLFFRSYSVVILGCGASESIFSTLLNSLFRAPMSFYDSTPVGRILSRVSSDISNVDLDIAFKLVVTVGSIINAYSSFGVIAIITWPVLFIIIPMVYLIQLLQRYYFASAKEIMRINGTTKSLVASHLAESIAGAMIIRASGEEERFFSKNLDLIDTNASPYFHSFAANEWLVQRLEFLCAIVLSSAALFLTLFPLGASASGYIGMALSYGLTLNIFLIIAVNQQSMLANSIISIERLEQYMHLPSEAPEVVENNRPPHNWPSVGKVEICNLKVRYRANSPYVLRGISCIFEGGDKIGIVGRTGSGKTTLISTLFRLVEPTEGSIIIDGIDISTIGLHDLRSHFGIIPQDPTLFNGSVRYNLDLLSVHTDQEIWEVLEKCQLREAIQEKIDGLDSLVAQDGSNWSMGQRQLFCLGRALLKRSQILVLDEATASIDNATDYILQKTIRKEFVNCTVITVAHRIPTVLDCTKVLGISDGELVEYDDPMKLIEKEGSLFGQLYKEYRSRSTTNADME